jgi:hypothetical protein
MVIRDNQKIWNRRSFDAWEIIIFFFVGWIGMFFVGSLIGNNQATKYYGKEISIIKEACLEKEMYLVGRLHAVHGISSSEEINGEYYFYRNGKKCKL